MDSIIGEATRTDIKHPNLPIQTMSDKIDMEMVEKLSYTDPAEVMEMARFFGAKEDSFPESDFMDKVRDIYKIARKSSLPLEDFLTELSLKVGGRYAEGFLDKAYTYLKALNNEMVIERQLQAARAETDKYGVPSVERISDVVQKVADELRNGISNRNTVRG